MKKFRLYILAVALPFSLAILVGISPLPLRTELQNLVFDNYQRLSPRIYDPASPVRIIDIDDESLKRYGRQWPWPRTQLAAFVDFLKAHGALAIGFDFLFAEPDQMGIGELIRGEPREQALARIAEELDKSGTYDEAFAKSLAGAPVILGAVLVNGTGEARAGQAQTEDQPLLPVKSGFSHAGDDPLLFLHGFQASIAPIKLLADQAAGIGALNWVPDRDRVIRQVPLLFGLRGEIVPSLAAEALRLAQEEGASYFVKSSNASGETAFGAQTGVVAVRIGKLVVNTQPRGDVRVRFTRHEPRRFIPVWKLLDNEVDPAEIENKIIFIGSSAAALGDMVTTPLDASVPGVEIHAQILEHILNGESLVRPDIADGIEMLVMILLSFIMMLVLPFVQSIVAALIGGVCVTALGAASWWAFTQKGLLLDPVFPSLSAGAVFLAGVLALYGMKQSQERHVRQAFGRFVSPAVVQRLAENPDKLILGGENRELTLLFCDLRSFTTISEGFDAHGLTRFLNEYLTPMTDVVLDHGGTVDKYMGDAIMAFWNAPLDDPEHARNSAMAALAMRAELAKLNARWHAEAEAEHRSFPEVRFGVGLNTGICCVGNLGSTRRFDYSAIGDDVNVASRLEGATKFLGVDIAANAATRDEAPDLAWLEIDRLVVKGKSLPIVAHALVGDEKVAQSQSFKALAESHCAMLDAFRCRLFDKALFFAEEAASLAPAQISGLYAFYRTRIMECLKEGPGEDWSPMLVLEEK
ncbi:MAG: adenylate/guanylate cyclase domain-containing protein [Hyphomicrobiales bacterium]|nr:adenylate/guanylate cyclase domain-containing protein [Hyphomicrobiales bacterium]MBV9519230.1 adenylate/guanylate cyclase domain-containing protein [Hyphomicrobiales bacterium]